MEEDSYTFAAVPWVQHIIMKLDLHALHDTQMFSFYDELELITHICNIALSLQWMAL